MALPPVARIGLLWQRNPAADERTNAENPRLRSLFSALADLHVDAVPVLYSDDAVDTVRNQLLQLDGVLVWVNPIGYGRARSFLDALLREVSAEGVWVSVHPDVILQMGTKEVTFRTRHLSWGTDTDLYTSVHEFTDRFPKRLAAAGPRVVKQLRGNGGIGVWKVALLSGGSASGVGESDQTAPGPDAPVRVIEAQRGSVEEDMPLGDFMHRCMGYFAGSGRLIDQPFQQRLPEGMIRCYLSQDTVIGVAHQLIRGLMPAPAGRDVTALPQPGPRRMQPATAPGFEALRETMESDWVPAMCQLLGLDRAVLPVLWDADFLLGPKTESGNDTYVLCEINVSSVAPFPEFAAGQIARAALHCVLTAKQSRV